MSCRYRGGMLGSVSRLQMSRLRLGLAMTQRRPMALPMASFSSSCGQGLLKYWWARRTVRSTLACSE